MRNADRERCEDAEHERWADCVGSYVLGALGDDECAFFEAHLAGCPLCAGEVEDLSPLTSALAVAVPPREPPADLLGRIMGPVRAQAELLRAAGAGADRPPRRSSRLRWQPVTAALAVGAMAAAAAVGFVAGNTDTGAQSLSARIAIPHGASARIDHPDHPDLVVAGFPPSPAARVYQVWFVPRGGGAPHPTKKLFVVGQDGSAEVRLPSLRGVRQVMVTTEQPSGSTTGKPSSTPVLTATLL